LNDYKWTINDANKIISLDPGLASAYSIRGDAKINLSQVEEWCLDLKKWFILWDTTFTENVKKCESILNKSKSQNCVIKWNISYNSQEKIYHFPWCHDYNATVINTSYWERWFCSEAEAKSAWWRKAYNCP
jgi:hypothetical protein